MPLFRDQTGYELNIPDVPKRIISIVPSQTELLYDLGLEDKIIGQTIFCVHPKSKFASANKIGGTKKLRLDAIRALNPDIIIANKEENEQSQIESLRKEFPVWTSDIKSLNQAYNMIQSLGEIFQITEKTNSLVHSIQNAFSELAVHNSKKTCLYFIWKEPWMAAGRDTFISEMMDIAGFSNAISDPLSRYPELSEKDIASLNPDIVLLSSEPYPFQQKHIDDLSKIMGKNSVYLADGEMFSWYGSRLLQAAKYFLEFRKITD